MPDPLKRLVAWLWDRWPFIVTAAVVIGYLVSKIYPIVKGWLELRKAQLDAKKNVLEIRKLEREEKDGETLVRVATFDEVIAYDPKARELDYMAQSSGVKRRARRRDLKEIIWTIVFILLIPLWLLYLFQHGGLAQR